MTKISIITVCFNSASTIRDATKSVLTQGLLQYRVYRCLWGLNGWLDILSEYGDRISKVICEPDQGVYDAMSKGIAAATGDVVGLLMLIRFR